MSLKARLRNSVNERLVRRKNEMNCRQMKRLTGRRAEEVEQTGMERERERERERETGRVV